MDGIRVLLVALLLCVAPIGGVVVASDPAGEPQQTAEDSERSMTVFAPDNTSEYLAPELGAIDRTDGRTTTIDVAGSVEADVGDLRSVYLRETLQQRYDDAETAADRETVVEDGAERLSVRVDELESKERTAIQQYNDGVISTREFLRMLTVIDREARATEGALEWLESAADDLDMDDEADRAATEQIRLGPMQGPVREKLAHAMAGETVVRTHVETSGNGIVLAATDPADGTYVREAHDPSAKAADVPDIYGGNPSPALDRFTELYPWAINSFEAIDAMGPEQVRLYRFSASHSHGELETYLDSGSTDVLYERQWLYPEASPSRVVERTQGDLRLVVNATWGGGPIGVSVVDATTDEPVDATVQLNGDEVGSTGGDRLWTVAPRGTTTINATHAGETATLETQLG